MGEVINFLLPLDDLDDIKKIKEIKNNFDQLDIDTLVNKYNIDNYVFALMNHERNKLKVYLKTKFENNDISKNISYDLENFGDDKKLTYILKDLKTIITDLWKKNNLVNLSMPLSINLQFKHLLPHHKIANNDCIQILTHVLATLVGRTKHYLIINHKAVFFP